MPRTYKPRPGAPRDVDDHIRAVDDEVYDTRFTRAVSDLSVDELPAPTSTAALDSPHRHGAQLVKRHVELVNDAIKGSPLDELYDKLASFHDNIPGFVHWAFPWGEKGTPLEGMTGPEQWQLDQQVRISDRIREGGAEGCVVEEDVSSGHGVGKSAEVAWLILWAISTCEDTRGVVTANTDLQLRTKTWAELSKWFQMFIAKQLFTLTATSIYVAGDKDREKSWRIDQVPWSAEKTEAFAGLHNQGKRLLVIFDEASQIHDNVWTVTEGALTDAKTEIIWCRYGNPTRTSGKFFHNCSQGKRNTYARVDSRTISFTNKAQIQAWVDEYGEDSDFVRVRVKGMFPRAGFDNFISPALVTEARHRRLLPDIYRAHPRVIACDPARFGDDSTVITLRQGLKVHWQLELKGFDGFDIAARIANLCRGGMDLESKREKLTGLDGPIACIVYDAIGNGAELDGALRRIPNLSVPLIPVMWGQPAKDDKQYFNQRSEAWGKMKEFLENGSVPDNDELAEQLTGLSYGYDGRFRIQLESKKDAKKRGVKSPDRGDSLALSLIPDLIDRKVSNAKVRPVVQRRVVWSR